APPLPSDGPIPGAGAPVGPLPGAAPGDGSPGGPFAEKPKRKEKTAQEEERDQELLDYLVSLIRRAENDEFARLESLVPYFGLTAMEVCQKADADADKQITRSEISEELPLCLPFFDDWDRSKKGTLSRTDLVLGFCSARIKYQRMQQTLSDDENEQSAMKFVFKKEPSEIFAFLDRNRDNVIDTDDAPEGEAEEFAEMIARFDMGNDGRVNADEFSKGIARFKQEIGQTSAVKNSSDAPQGEPPK
ncbi:MAG: hypothetical protein J6S75_06990, partial [Thermoguttaceae bacterium]|nr:hypothetical protein [Thermoguttaceae bacterium]